MRPLFNSFPHQSQQQQGFQSSSALENQCNNNINMLMMQQTPQMGVFNPQSPLLNNVGFMNGTNQHFPSQNNHLGFPQFGPIFPNLNNVSMFQQLPSQINNHLQNPNQPNWLNLPPQNNMSLTNGQQQQQLFLQNQLQNMGQLLNVQIPNVSQFVSGGQTMGCLNTTLVSNPQFGFMQQANQSQQSLADVNASKPLSSGAASQVLGGPSFTRPMGDPGKNGQNLNYYPGRNGKRDSKWGFQKSKYQQSQFHQADNVKRKFASSNGHKKKGKYNERAAKFPHSDSTNPDKEKRRHLFSSTAFEMMGAIPLMASSLKLYSSCFALFMHFSIQVINDFKLSGKVADSEVARLRSEQLKEILAKQDELGVEVAEIPSHYLLGSSKKVNGREENSRPSTKKGRFEMRHDKRGRYDKKDRSSKNRRSTNEESFDGTSLKKRNPTLLQKLLSADIRKDRSSLLRVFRFMVINSFFKDWPEKPLKFPVVVMRDGMCEGDIVQEKPFLVGKGNVEICNETMIQNIIDGDGDGDDDHENKDGGAGGDHGYHSENDDIENKNKEADE
ncbi:hypothetical protein REPUB_Repub03eG0256700 [Reevesia pubescens]